MATAQGSGRRRPARKKPEKQPAAQNPIARVAVDVSLPHLDRLFDYRIPSDMDEAAQPGVRVRVRFNRQLTDGFLIERVQNSEFGGRLSWLERVVSPEQVASPDLLATVRMVAERYAGTLSDVLRLAIPPRHARVEAEPARAAAEISPEAVKRPEDTEWRQYQHGSAFLRALSEGKPARAVWQALPGEDWARRLAEAALVTAAEGHGVLLVLPDQRDVARLEGVLAEAVGEKAVVALTSEPGPAERYRRWLSVHRGRSRIVVGTRAAMFAPVRRLGLAVIWDDGDEMHSYPLAPYPHAREVLSHRAHASGAALLVAGFARTAEAQLYVDSGWAAEVVATREELRARAPRVTALGEDDVQLARDPAARAARLPSVAFDAARQALKAGAPVLVQVPRRGYIPAVACAQCRERASCRRCSGPLSLGGPSLASASPGESSGLQSDSLANSAASTGDARPVSCRWCGATEAGFRCGRCGSRRLRALAVGAERTAEELGRAFAGVPVRTSSAAGMLREVPAKPALVVATPGAEPRAAGGYGAGLLLDGRGLLARADLRASEDALRLWLSAAALVRSGTSGGRVVVMADAELSTVQALVRWAPAWHASAELASRAELGFPPAQRVATVDGPPDLLAEFLDTLELGPSAEILGPVPLEEHSVPPGPADATQVDEPERERALIRVPRPEGRGLAAALRAGQASWGAKRMGARMRIQLDPLRIL